MNKSIMLLFMLGLLSACSYTKVVRTYDSNGKEVVHIACRGRGLVQAQCIQKAAGDTCGTRGYNILNEVKDKKGIVRGLTITCKF